MIRRFEMIQQKSVRWILVLFLGLAIRPGFTQTDVPEGKVSGLWSLANSPYHINGEITVPDDSTLTIEPGVEVVFTWYYKLNVQGRLLAIGTEQDYIVFSSSAVTGWHGIRFVDTPASNDSSNIVYCQIQDGKASGAFPDNCGGAICMSGYGKCVIAHCRIVHNSATYVGGGIVLGYGASPVIANNMIANNEAPYGGGLACVGSCHPLTGNNLIIHNDATNLGGGIQMNQNSNPILFNNTIAYNHAGSGGGIDCRDNSDPTLINNIIWDNTANDGDQVCLYSSNCDPHFYHCDIEGGLSGFGGPGIGENYGGTYQNNMDSDPMFLDASHNDYHLSDSSPCISAGLDSIQIGSKWYFSPALDFDGNPRPNPAGSLPDIGAYESLQGNSASGVQVSAKQVPLSCVLMQNYPNPFNPCTTIRYRLPISGFVSLKIYNILGKEIAVLVREVKNEGCHSMEWQSGEHPTGIYFARLESGETVETIRMVLQK